MTAKIGLAVVCLALALGLALVQALPGLAAGQLANGDFELGPGVGWTEHSLRGWPIIVDARYVVDLGVAPHGGGWLAWLGGDNSEVSYIQQQVEIAPGVAQLGLWNWIDSEDVCGWDYGRVLVNGAQVTAFTLCMGSNTGGWVRRTVDLSVYAGQSVSLQDSG